LCHISTDEYKSRPEIIDIPLNVPKKRIIKATLSNIKDVIKKELSKNDDKDIKNDIKIKLDVTNEEFKLFKETKDYKDLINKGIKIQINKRSNKKDKNESDEKNDSENNFTSILENMVKNDEIMVKNLYDEIILNKILITI
jgi:hypothetical protein